MQIKLPRYIKIIDDNNKNKFILEFMKEKDIGETLGLRFSNSQILIEKLYENYLNKIDGKVNRFGMPSHDNFIIDNQTYSSYQIHHLISSLSIKNKFYITTNNIFDEIIKKLEISKQQMTEFCKNILTNDVYFLNADVFFEYLKKADLNLLDNDKNDFLIYYIKMKNENNKNLYNSKILNYLVDMSSIRNNCVDLNASLYLLDNPDLFSLLNQQSIEKLAKNYTKIDLVAEKYQTQEYYLLHEKMLITKNITNDEKKIFTSITKKNKI